MDVLRGHQGLDQGRKESEPHHVIEQKFQDTLEEVFALKRILQDFLSEPMSASSALHPRPETTSDGPSNASHSIILETHESDEAFDFEDLADGHVGPTVRASRGSERWLRRSAHFEPNFQARMRYYMMKREQNKYQIQTEINDKAAEELKLAPTINQRSKRIHRSVDHLHAWNREKEQKIAELREAKAVQELCEVTNIPRIAHRSEMLVATRADDLAQCKVEDRLHLLGLIYEYQQEERMLRAAERDRRTLKSPSVAPHSTRLVRNSAQPAHERLHGISRSMKKASCEPYVNERHKQVRPVKPKATVEAAIRRLLEHGELYGNNRQELALQLEQRMKDLQASAKISEASAKLASKARSRQNHTDSVLHRQCTCCQPEDERPEDPPQVNAAEASKIYDRHVKWKQRREAWCKEEKERLALLEEAELVFRNPQYRPAWDSFEESNVVGNEHRDGRRKSNQPNDAFFKKSLEWSRAKQRQLDIQRAKQEALELRECTFRPSVKPPRAPEEPHRSPRSFLKCASAFGPGYFSRTNMATPMLGLDASEASSDNLDSLDETSCGTADVEAPVIFIDNGVRRQ